MVEKIIKSMGYGGVISVIFIFIVGNILNMLFHYTREAITSYMLITDSLLVGTIFTIILCTLIILEKLKKIIWINMNMHIFIKGCW